MKRWMRGGIVLCFLAVIYCYAKKDIGSCEQHSNKLKGIVLPQFPEISGTIEVQVGEYVDDTVLLAYTRAIENMLESNGTDCFIFMRGEKAICYYEGKGQDYDYRFALYRRTQDANLVFVNMIYIDSLTELHMYTFESDNSNEYREIKPSEYRQEAEVRDLLKEKDIEHQHLEYDGVRDFLGKSYYGFSAVDDTETHIMRTQSYYVDATNGNVYRMSETDDVFMCAEFRLQCRRT